jgi:uridine phosphorylase
LSFPNHPDKHADPSLLRAEDIVAYRRRLGRMPALASMRGALFCLERGLPRRMRWRIPVKSAGSMNATVHTVKKTGGRVAVLTEFGGGSPMVVELAEELAVMGAQRMILMTWGGALQPGLEPGDIVVCERAVRDEGASHHYLPSEKYVHAEAGLVQQLADAIRARGGQPRVGATWTTDAPYRETEAEVRAWQAEGVQTVEMEAAGLFTVGRVRGLATAAVVVVMDSLADYRWHAPESLAPIQRALEIVYAAAIDVLDTV